MSMSIYAHDCSLWTGLLAFHWQYARFSARDSDCCLIAGNPPFPHTPTSSSAHAPTPYPPQPNNLSSPPTSHPSAATLNPNASTGGEPMPVDLSLDPHSVPSELKKEGPDWFAIFNDNAGKEGSGPNGGNGKKKALDVGLVHTLMHERCAA